MRVTVTETADTAAITDLCQPRTLHRSLKIMCLMQANLISKWEEFVGQLAAEIMGSREEFALSVLGKRKSEVLEAMSEVRPGDTRGSL